MNIIAEALKRNSAPAIEGLDDAISHLEDIDREIRRFGARDLFSVYKMSIPANLKTDSDFLVLKVIQAARAYAALPKMQKVDLDRMKFDCTKKMADLMHIRLVLKTIDDIKFKYGELYAEVK